VELVCIKNYQTNDFVSDSFEDYYDYYNDNIGDFTLNKKYEIIDFRGIEVGMQYFHTKMVVSNRIAFRIFEKIDGNNSPYLFDYFCLEHEWLAMQRNEKIENILE
jgi:hypothetical protein